MPIPPLEWIIRAQSIDNGEYSDADISAMCEADPVFLLWLLQRKAGQLAEAGCDYIPDPGPDRGNEGMPE